MRLTRRRRRRGAEPCSARSLRLSQIRGTGDRALALARPHGERARAAALVIAEPGRPTNETSSRMLCLQIATAAGPIVPVVSVTEPHGEPALPVALAASHHHDRLVGRLQSALRVRALHATVLRRCDAFSGAPPQFPTGDALDDATVLVAGRGPLYPPLKQAMGERVRMVGALSVVTAAKHLEARQIDARRIAGLLKTAMPSPHRAHAKVTANVTLAT